MTYTSMFLMSLFRFRIILAAAFLPATLPAQSFTISTVAGTTRFVPGAAATSTPLRRPDGVAQDAAGNIYVADTDDNRVFRIGTDGKIAPIAGTGQAGFSGDKGAATDAQFDSPRALRLDGNGGLLIGDYNNNRIRKVVLATGIVTTVAGNGKFPASGDKGPATHASLDPNDFAVDNAGNIFIADALNNRIRKVSASDGTITTIAGTGLAGDAGDTTLALNAALDNPTGISVDAQGVVYFADYYNNRIRNIDPKSGIINTFAGTGFLGIGGDEGPATKADLALVLGTAVEATGNVLILGFNNIRRVTVADGKIHPVCGSTDVIGFSGDGGLVSSAVFAIPLYIAAAANGDILMSDTGNFRVRRIRSSVINTVAGRSIDDGIPATTAFLNIPVAAIPDGKGGLLISDTGDNRIRAVSPAGVISNVFGNGVRGSDPGELDTPGEIALDAAGNLFIADTNNDRILRLAQGATQPSVFAGGNGTGFSGDGGFALRAKLDGPTGVAVDAAGNLYIADFGNARVRKVDSDGNITTVAGSGIPVFGADGGAATSAGVAPLGVAVDSAGNLFIADSLNNRIRKVDMKTKIITTVAGSGLPGSTGDSGLATLARLNDPEGVAVDAAGTVYIADSGNHLLRAVAGGMIRTVAGTGAIQFQAESGSSVGVNVDPIGVSVSSDGSIYIADMGNDRIRKLSAAKPALLSISFGDGQSGPPGNTVPLSVKVTESNGTPVAGVTVNFSVASGSATLSAPSALTDPTGVASVKTTFGTTQGPVKILAISAGLTGVTFNLMTLAPAAPTPTIGAGGLTGAGLSVPSVQALSSNGIASIFGSNFGAGPAFKKVGTADLVNGAVPTNFAGICVDVSGTRAPVFGASDTQVNFQAPLLNPGQTVTVKVISACDAAGQVASNGVTAPAEAASPEFFYFAVNANGNNPVAATDSVSGAGLASASLFPGSGFAPAKPGQYVTIYATGFGATNPSIGAGVFYAGLAPAAGTVRVLLNGQPLPTANVLYAGATPSSPGLYQLNLLMPADTPDGDLPLVIEVVGIPSPGGAFLTVSGK
jgi:uncharacterized protein (TIGR03437 family)